MRARMLAVAWLLQVAAGSAGPKVTDFRYRRELVLPAGVAAGAQSCAVLDGTVYAHAEPALADVRLFSDKGAPVQEIPYALTISETGFASDPAPVLNLGKRGQTVTFDLQMPDRLYSGLLLQLGGANFLATAKVTGLKSLKDANGTALGTFALFDLSGQRLGRNTTVALPESSFPFLHVELAFSDAPGQPRFEASPALVEGAQVPPSREAQTLYTPVAETSAVTERGQESVAAFVLPAHVPVERVSFVLAPGYTTNFSRPVRILARADKANGGEDPASEEIRGEISRVRMTQGGDLIRESSLGVPALLGSNLQSSAKVEVAVENGDDRPLGIQAVRLEMRQRKLCFDAPAISVALYSGAQGMKAPVYDFSRVFLPAQTVAVARLGQETANPAYLPPVDTKPFSERHPALLWVALVGVVLALAGVAWRSTKRIEAHRDP